MPPRIEYSQLDVYRDLSQITSQRLVETIIANAQADNCPVILADETLPRTLEISEYHARLQHVQELESLQPDMITAAIISGATANFTKDQDRLANFGSLDELVSKRGTAVVRPDTLNDLRISKPEQVLFLRAVIIATTAREIDALRSGDELSHRQSRILRQALSTLRHMATNVVYVPEQLDDESRAKFETLYVTNYLARTVMRELHVQGGLSHSTSSIDDALGLPIAFGRLHSGDQESVVAVFPPGKALESESENLGFKPVYSSEIDIERIARLRDLQSAFGSNLTEFRYFESIQPFMPNRGQSGTANQPNGLAKKTPDDEDYSYLVLEITHPNEDDVMKRHVVADHPQVGNACYALRQEVLEEWERLIGIRLNWRDLFTQSRKTASQLGARPFHHNKGSDVSGRVQKYLLQEAESLVLETFASIFDAGEREIFDDQMQPTKRNRLPTIIIEQIQNSSVLREKWAAIRQYGYADVHRTEQAKARMTEPTPVVRERRVSMQDLASEIFARLVQGPEA